MHAAPVVNPATRRNETASGGFVARIFTLILLAATLSLAACGGGNDGARNPPPPTTNPPVQLVDSDQQQPTQITPVGVTTGPLPPPPIQPEPKPDPPPPPPPPPPTTTHLPPTPTTQPEPKPEPLTPTTQPEPDPPPPPVSQPDGLLKTITALGSNRRDNGPASGDIHALPATRRTTATDGASAFSTTHLTSQFLPDFYMLNSRRERVYNAQALLPVKANYAYARGYTGAGVVIGIIDSGFNAAHRELASQLFLEQGETTYTNHDVAEVSGCIGKTTQTCTEYTVPLELNRNKTQENYNHGTQTASIAAGSKDNPDITLAGQNVNIHGIAYGSQLSLRSIWRDQNRLADSRPTGRDDGEYFAAAFALHLSSMMEEGIQVLNLSVSFNYNRPAVLPNGETKAVPYTVRDMLLDGEHLIDSFYHLQAEAIYAADTDPASDKEDALLVVWAAGNYFGYRWAGSGLPSDYADHPIMAAGLGLYYPELRDRTLAVIALDTRELSTKIKAARTAGTLTPALLDKWLSTRSDQPSIANFSNSCGITGPWCLAAPGTRLALAATSEGNNQDEYTLANGTSFAAPIVTGALAILIEQFGLPDNQAHHSNTEILARLLQTANRSGRYAPDSIFDPNRAWTISNACGGNGQPACQFNDVYGMGLVDLDAASRPWGTLSAVYDDSSVGGASISSAERFNLDVSHIKFSPAFGDALSQALEDKTAYFFDVLDFAFSVPAVSFVPEVQSNRMASRLAAFDRIERHVAGDWYGMGFASGEANGKAGLYLMPSTMAEGKAGFAGLDSYLSLAQEGQGFAAGWQNEGHSLGFALLTGEEKKDAPGSRVMALAYGYETPKGVGVSLRAGWAEEESALLGARTSGLYGQSEAGNTFFASLGASLPLAKGWHVFADIEAGRTEASQAVSGAYEASALVSANMAAGVWRKNAVVEGDWLGFMVSQPLRIETGDARFSYASGRESNAVVVMTHEEFSLTPSGRTLDLQMAYHAPASSGWSWQVAAGLSINANHRAGNADHWVLLGLNHKF